MNNQHITLYTGLLASALVTGLMGGCGGSDSGSGTGTLNLQITDAAVDDADNVFVVFTGVEIKAAGGATIDITYDAPRKIDLLALTGGDAQTIVDNQILPAGQVEWIRLKVDASNGGDPMEDSYIVINGTPHELTIPSSSQSGLKLNRPVTIAEDGVASFTIDFDLRKSVHLDNNGYKLRPTLRLVDNHTYGALSGTVAADTITTAGCTGGDKAAVYVFTGNDIVPDDINIDGNDVEPVSTASVDWATGDYTYTVAFLPAGSYTVAFTCDAGIDTPDNEETLGFVGTTNVAITAGLTTVKNF